MDKDGLFEKCGRVVMKEIEDKRDGDGVMKHKMKAAAEQPDG